jgi:hypothetical protein
MNTIGTPAVGKAKDVACPRCHAKAGEACTERTGLPRPFHVERARVARWQFMGLHDEY